jgi:hypothetical protein
LSVREASVVAQQLHDPSIEVVELDRAVRHGTLANDGWSFWMLIVFAFHNQEV